MIYFDHAATSGIKPPAVIEAIVDCLKNANANPGRSSHSLSIKAAEIIYRTREVIGELFNFPETENIILTKNATEALNLAIYGTLGSGGGEAITTSMEHNSVLRPLNRLREKGLIRLKIVEGDTNGLISPQKIEEAISDNTRLVIATAASNVCGSRLDLEGILQVCQSKGVKLLVDAAQGAGAIEIDLTKTPFDFLAITGHKHLFGPQGTGALIIKEPDSLEPFMCGGTGSLSEKTIQPDFPPDKFEAGTLNTPGCAGLCAGIEFILSEGLNKIISREQHLVSYLLDKLSGIEEAKVYAAEVTDRLAVVSFNLEGAMPSEVSHYLDRKWQIYTRPGLHCAPQAHQTLGSFPQGTVRISLSYFNTEQEIDTAIEALKSYVCTRS
ncbi:MAG: aminotransferase class V-fold PLP-dependent enzyme [bacterium]|nr:aminotransferase class V-fold PLP-dependent enzyme [bacterium]